MDLFHRGNTIWLKKDSITAPLIPSITFTWKKTPFFIWILVPLDGIPIPEVKKTTPAAKKSDSILGIGIALAVRVPI